MHGTYGSPNEQIFHTNYFNMINLLGCRIIINKLSIWYFLHRFFTFIKKLCSKKDRLKLEFLNAYMIGKLCTVSWGRVYYAI